MQPIFQHILTGINHAGIAFIGETSDFLKSRGFDLSEKTAVKLWLKTDREGNVEYPAIVDDHHIMPADDADALNDMDRRKFPESFLQSYPTLEETIRARWREATSPELKMEMARAGIEFKGKKVFIAADIFDPASSALMLPLMAALRYALRSEGISDIHWNILAFCGPGKTPPAMVRAYAFLRELAFLKQSPEPVTVNLSVPPFQKEVPLGEGDPVLYIIDSSGAGVAPLSVRETAQVAARYVFIETFHDAPQFGPSDREAYFHTFGTSQACLNLDEIIDTAAELSAERIRELLGNMDGAGRKAAETAAKDALLHRKINPEKISGLIPDFSDYIWKSPSIDLSDFKTPAEMMDGPGNIFKASLEEQEKAYLKVFGKKADESECFTEISGKAESLLDNELYGIAAALELTETASARARELYVKADSMKIPPPSDDELNRRIREMSSAISTGMPFPVIIMLFVFTLIPLASTVFDFIHWKYSPQDIHVTGGILGSVLLLSMLGGWIQKYLMDATLAEKFQGFSGHVEEFFKSRYLHRLNSRAEAFYMSLLGLLTGENPSAGAKAPGESLVSKISSFAGAVNNAGFKPVIRKSRFYGAPLLVNPEEPEKLKSFIAKFFAGKEWTGDDKTPFISPSIFEAVAKGLPSFADSGFTGDSYMESLFNGLGKLLLDISAKREIKGPSVIQGLGPDVLTPVFENLRDFSKPLASVEDNRLAEEANCRIDEKIILGDGAILKTEILTELAEKMQFSRKPVESENSLLFLQTIRYLQFFKLKDLENWKYYEERVDEENRRNLYLSDIFISAPHIDYESRAGREAGHDCP